MGELREDDSRSGNEAVWLKETIEIAAGTTGSSLEISGSNVVKYFMLAEGNLEVYSLEMNVFTSIGNIFDSVSNKFGNMDVTIESVLDTDKIHVDIANNEAFDIIVTLNYLRN